MQKIYLSNSIERLENAELLGAFEDSDRMGQEVSAVLTALGYSSSPYWRILALSGTLTAIDFGSWSKFIIVERID